MLRKWKQLRRLISERRALCVRDPGIVASSDSFSGHSFFPALQKHLVIYFIASFMTLLTTD